MFPPDEIHIAGLVLVTKIGVADDERSQPQTLTAFITLRTLGGFAGLDDQIEKTVNYAAVCETVKSIASDRPRRLLETLGCDIAEGILGAYPACEAVDVELRKFILPHTDHVAVRLSRQRP